MTVGRDGLEAIAPCVGILSWAKRSSRAPEAGMTTVIAGRSLQLNGTGTIHSNGDRDRGRSRAWALHPPETLP